jgi:hypothetical protein
MSPESGNQFRDKDMRKNKQIERFQRLLINRNRSRRGKGFKFLQKALYEAHLLKVGK